MGEHEADQGREDSRGPQGHSSKKASHIQVHRSDDCFNVVRQALLAVCGFTTGSLPEHRALGCCILEVEEKEKKRK